ncbi:MAG: hypothetical protein ACFCAD_01030 [Pleurocapsa sp.]
MLSVSTKNHIAVGEPSNEPGNNLKSNYQKPLQGKKNFTYKKAISHELHGGRIATKFSPKDNQGYKIKLDTLASELGYDHFNWVSYVEVDPYGIADRDGNIVSAPYNDPPLGGYQYDYADKLPFYWDVENCDRCRHRNHIQNRHNLQQFDVTFEDAPTDNRLQIGESIEFITSLVGVKSIDSASNRAEWDMIYTFRWKVTNISQNSSQVALGDSNGDPTELSPFLMAQMILDGADLSTPLKISSSN